ncbi:hypothetical protein GYMLUDRAFT_190085 [Collybiopsis luxurians FD-317 M1]|nr:hypothetical protein GYMLUDRAFT_190085 [Collybiopsis luxurians FD-317 M1]
MPGKTVTRKQPADAQDLFSKLSNIFDQVQNTTANHQKNIIALHKIYIDIAQIRGKTKDGATILTGEKQFEQVIYAILLRLLETKKGAPGDRVVKFFAGFVRHLNDKAAEDPIDEDDIDEYNVAYTPAARFTERLVCKLLVNGFAAKEKTVRYRAVQISAELVFSLGEIDDKVYYDLRNKLLERINDKETSIRSQAAIALCKFHGIDDPQELKERKLDSLEEVLIESLAYDPQPEVRRAILCNFPLNKAIIVHLLQRTRDVDHNVRKLAYGVLADHLTVTNEDNEPSMGFTHPRVLSIEDRELIVRNGLGDREPAVRAAAAKLIEKWVETADLSNQPQPKQEGEQAETAQYEGLLGLLKLFDLSTDKIVADALISLFESSPHYVDEIIFSDTYWASLTPETAFLARVSVEYYQSQLETCPSTKRPGYTDRLDNILPVVTSFAFRLGAYFDDLVDYVQRHEKEMFGLGDEERQLRQDELESKQAVVVELLKIAVLLDYGDEIGRRRMHSLVRDMLIHDYLPEDLVAPCMEVLSLLADSERDLVRLVAIEIVQALRDPGDDEDEVLAALDPDSSFDSAANTPGPDANGTAAAGRRGGPKRPEEMTEAERTRADKIDKRCLCICESMLERINGTLENNSSLDGIVKELIYPAVQRKDGEFRHQGLRCLGLIGLISKGLATQALAFFLRQMMAKGDPDELRIVGMQAVFDNLMVYRSGIMTGSLTREVWVDKFMELLKDDEATSEDVRAVLCMGLAKLALSRVLVDEKIMELLLKDYFSPKNVNNQKLKQCLSFFFQAYCASSVENQRMISTMFISVFRDLCKTREDMEDGEEMASMAQIANMILDWTHPNRLFTESDKDKSKEGDGEGPSQDTGLHFDIAKDIVKELLDKDSELLKEHKKVLCQQLSKLYLPNEVDEDEVRYLSLRMNKVHSHRPLGDTVSKNAFAKFQASFVKKYEKYLEGLSAEEYLSHEKHQAEAAFLDQILPLEDEAGPSGPKRGRKRRSGSMASSVADDEQPKKTTRGRKTKRPRRSTPDDDSSDEGTSVGDGVSVGGDGDEDDGTEQGSVATSSRRSSVAPPPPPPTRIMPKRNATRRPPVEVIAISSDSDEEEEDDDATPRDRRARPSVTKAAKIKQEKGEDEEKGEEEEDGEDVEDEQVFSQATVAVGENDSEGEEDEVSGLLAED